jgi:hypothetical protein
MNIKNYYLDLEKVRNLTDENERSKIHDYYRDLIMDSHPNIESMFNTLYYNGFLKEMRNEKIEKILG